MNTLSRAFCRPDGKWFVLHNYSLPSQKVVRASLIRGNEKLERTIERVVAIEVYDVNRFYLDDIFTVDGGRPVLGVRPVGDEKF